MKEIDKIVTTIISLPIAEEHATGLFTKAIQADELGECLEEIPLEEVEDILESIEELETTPQSARIAELTIQVLAAQGRLSIQNILTDSSIYIPPILSPHVGQIEAELVNGAVWTYIDQHPAVVDTLISTAREMLDPGLMCAEFYASIEADSGVEAKNREIVADYLVECVQDRVLSELDDALEKAIKNS